MADDDAALYMVSGKIIMLWQLEWLVGRCAIILPLSLRPVTPSTFFSSRGVLGLPSSRLLFRQM